jgi:hypothetical protein
MLQLLSPPARVSTLAFFLLFASGCSSTATGTDDSCPGGVCEPKPVFARGTMTAFVVTPDSVYAAIENTCSVYVAAKPVQESRVLATEACNVTSLAATKDGLFWTLVPLSTTGQPTPKKGTFAWLPAGATRPVIIDSTLDAPLASIAALGDHVYVTVTDGILRLNAAASRLDRVVTTTGPYSPTALRGHDGSLYFHDGYDTIFAWRPGDEKARVLVEHAAVLDAMARPGAQDEPFVVDASGIYWIQPGLLEGGSLAHAPLAGGVATKLQELPGSLKTLAIDEGALYWTEADDPIIPKKTTIHRTPKSALGTSSVLGALVGEVNSLQVAPEGLYLAAAPSLSDFDFDKLGFKRYGGPLLILPRELLDRK